MAEASDLKWRVTEIAICPICLEDCKNAKMLPCVHSFCLGCLQSYFKGNAIGDNVACPVCRKEFQIPDTGLEALPHNFFLQNLIDARDASSPKTEVLCEVCVAAKNGEDEDKGEIPSATVYCADCNLKLCTQCSRPCRVKPRGEPHHVRPLGAEMTAELIQQRGSYCDQHKDDRLKLYCHDCEITVCLMCFVVSHNGHKGADVEKAAGEFIEQFFDSTIESVSSLIDGFHVALEQVDTEIKQFQSAMDEGKTSIRQRWEAVNRITEEHANRLLEEVQTAESGGLKEASNRSEELKLAVTSLESFKIYLAELKSKGSPCDITQVAKAMRCRASELLETYVIPNDYHAPRVSFNPMNIDELTNEEQNLVGRISQQTDRSGINNLLPCVAFIIYTISLQSLW